MKKWVVVPLCLALIFAAGCFASPEKDTTESSEPATTAAVTTTTVAATTTQAGGANISEFPCTAYATDSLNVRRTPNTDYHAVGGLHANEQVTVIGRSGDFYEIEFRWSDTDENDQAISGTTAFVSAQYISLNGVVTTQSTTATTTAATTAATTTAAAH